MARFSFPVLTSLFALLASTAVAVKPLVIQGSQFVDADTDTRFQIIGVDYQPGGASGYDKNSGEDVLTDPIVCLRDATLLQRLGANTIRIYNVNPTLDHDECMSIYNAAGIYVMLDVNSPVNGEALNRRLPWTTYHKGYLLRVFQMVDAFKGYPNTLAFFGGNEVINEQAHKEVPAYIRAVQRDLRNYIDEHSDRPIPVGYSAADVRDILEDTWNYVSCELEDEPTSRSEFFGLNSYSWCGDATYESSEYNKLVDMFQGTSNPIFFSEYGCNEVMPRVFTEVGALYGENMTEVFGGGLIYEYSQEKNNYGLAKIGKDYRIDLIVDYENLLEQYNKLDMDMLQSLNATSAEVDPPKCDKKLIKNEDFYNNFTLPEVPPGVKRMIEEGVPGAHEGKLVKVTETEVKTPVYTSKGKRLTGLKLKVIEDEKSNVPGENTSGTPTDDPDADTDADTDDSDGGDDGESAASANAKIAAGSIVAAVLSFFLM